MIKRLSKQAKVLLKTKTSQFNSISRRSNKEKAYQIYARDSSNKASIETKQDILSDYLLEMMERQGKLDRKIYKFTQNMTFIPFDSVSPVRDTLEYYIRLTNKHGFIPELVASATQILGKSLCIQRDQQAAFRDIDSNTLINNWRFYNLMQDIHYGLLSSAETFTLQHAATALNGLSIAKIKDTSVIEATCNKVRKVMGLTYTKPDLNDPHSTPSSGKYGFIPTNEEGREGYRTEEFKNILQRILPSEANNRSVSNKNMNALLEEIESQVTESRDLAELMVSNVDAVIEQYTELENTIKAHPELMNYDSIKFKLFKLQDILSQQSYLDVNIRDNLRLPEVNKEEQAELRRKNVQNVISTHAFNYFPQLYSKLSLELMQEKEKEMVFNSLDNISKRNLGSLMRELVKYSKLETKDIKGKDFFNNRITGELEEKTGKNAGNVDYHDYYTKRELTPEYTKGHFCVRQLFTDILPEIKNIAKSLSSEQLMEVYCALIEMGIKEGKTTKRLLSNINSTSKRIRTETLDRFLGFVCGSSQFSSKKMQILVEQVLKRDDHKGESAQLALRGLALHSSAESVVDFILDNKLSVSDKQARFMLKNKFSKQQCEITSDYLFDRSEGETELKNPIKNLLVSSIAESYGFSTYKSRIVESGAGFLGGIMEDARKPDLVIGNYGEKYGIYLLDYAEGAYLENGFLGSQAKIVETQLGIKPIFVSVADYLSIDLTNLEVKVKKDLVFDQILSNSDSNEIKSISDSIALEIKGFLSNVDPEGIKYRTDMKEAILTIDSINSNLLEAKLAYSKAELTGIISKLKANIPYIRAEAAKLDKKNAAYFMEIENLLEQLPVIKTKQTEFDWRGKRFGFDVIKAESEKDWTVEAVNHRFMLNYEYCYYPDWAEELKESYDELNYWEDSKKREFYFQAHQFNSRRCPEGIFPHPNKLVTFNSPKIEERTESEYANTLHKLAYKEELALTQTVKKNNLLSTRRIPAETSFKVNLLNIVNHIKRNVEQKEILPFISEFDFISKLLDGSVGKAKFAGRKVESYFEFQKKVNQVIEPYDSFAKFVMSEKARKDDLEDISDSVRLQILRDEYDESPETKDFLDKYDKHMKDNFLHDSISVFPPVESEFVVKDKLAKREFNFNLTDSDFTDNASRSEKLALLNKKRVKAERNLILASIMAKLQANKELSMEEANYLRKIKEEAQFKPASQVGLSSSPTTLALQDISKEDMNKLNSMDYVEITKETAQFALSDLIFELDNLVDSNCIEGFIAALNRDFSYRGKEKYLLMLELKEQMWRRSGYINRSDTKNIKNMLRIKRNKSVFDKAWLKLDEASLLEFIEDINNYEDRYFALEEWIGRKELEISSRVNYPHPKLNKSDKELEEIFEKRDKIFREKLICKVFAVDSTSKISKEAVEQFSDQFIAKLPSFSLIYPSVVTDIFDSLLEVESLSPFYRDRLAVFRKKLQVDFSGEEQTVLENKVRPEKEKNFAGESYFEEFKSRLASANQPFLQGITEKI